MNRESIISRSGDENKDSNSSPLPLNERQIEKTQYTTISSSGVPRIADFCANFVTSEATVMNSTQNVIDFSPPDIRTAVQPVGKVVTIDKSTQTTVVPQMIVYEGKPILTSFTASLQSIKYVADSSPVITLKGLPVTDPNCMVKITYCNEENDPAKVSITFVGGGTYRKNEHDARLQKKNLVTTESATQAEDTFSTMNNFRSDDIIKIEMPKNGPARLTAKKIPPDVSKEDEGLLNAEIYEKETNVQRGARNCTNSITTLEGTIQIINTEICDQKSINSSSMLAQTIPSVVPKETDECQSKIEIAHTQAQRKRVVLKSDMTVAVVDNEMPETDLDNKTPNNDLTTNWASTSNESHLPVIKPSAQYQCPACPIKFANEDDRINHVSATHNHIRLYKCRFCERSYLLVADLSQHMALHTKVRLLGRVKKEEAEHYESNIRAVHMDKLMKSSDCSNSFLATETATAPIKNEMPKKYKINVNPPTVRSSKVRYTSLPNRHFWNMPCKVEPSLEQEENSDTSAIDPCDSNLSAIHEANTINETPFPDITTAEASTQPIIYEITEESLVEASTSVESTISKFTENAINSNRRQSLIKTGQKKVEANAQMPSLQLVPLGVAPKAASLMTNNETSTINDISSPMNTQLNRRTCQQCGRLFPNEWNLIQHRLKDHEHKRMYKCYMCDSIFVTENDFRSHLSNHLKSRVFQCPSCTYVAKTEDCLDEHLQLYHGNTPKGSERQNKQSLSGLKNTLPVSTVTRDADKAMRRVRVSKKTNLQQEMTNVIGKFSCKYCQRQFRSGSKLSDHIYYQHKGSGSYKCDICNRFFRLKCNFKRHLNSANCRG